jgi:hypothetical protein
MFMAINSASVPSQRRLGIRSAQKAALKTVLRAGISLSKACALAELNSKFPAILVKLGVTPGVVVDAIGSLADSAVDQLIGRRTRRLGVYAMFVNGATAIGNSAKTAGAGMTTVAGQMQGSAQTLNKLAGGALVTSLAEVGCPAIITAIKAGIMVQFPGVTVPACVSTWFTSQCKQKVRESLTGLRLLRRLSALRRDIANI